MVIHFKQTLNLKNVRLNALLFNQLMKNITSWCIISNINASLIPLNIFSLVEKNEVEKIATRHWMIFEKMFLKLELMYLIKQYWDTIIDESKRWIFIKKK